MSSSRRKDGSVSLSEQDFEQIVSKAVEAAMTVIRKELNERLSVLESRVESLEAKIRDIEQSSSTTSDYLTTLEGRVDSVESKCPVPDESLARQVTNLHDQIRNNTLHNNENEQYIRRNNLRFKGLQAGSDNECAQAVVDFVSSHLAQKIDVREIEAAHFVRRSTKPDSESAENNTVKPKHEPTILVRFKSRALRDEIIRRRKNLKASPFSISEDLTTLNLQTLNRFNKKDSVKKTWSWNGKLFAVLQDNTKILIRPFQTLEECTVCN